MAKSLKRQQRDILHDYIDRVRKRIIFSQNNIKPPLRASGALQASMKVDVTQDGKSSFLSSAGQYLATTFEGVGTRAGQIFPWRQLTQWLRFKGITGVRDRSGRFLPRKSIAYLMALKIWKFGSAVRRGDRKGVPIQRILKEELPKTSAALAEAYAQDFADDVKRKLEQ